MLLAIEDLNTWLPCLFSEMLTSDFATSIPTAVYIAYCPVVCMVSPQSGIHFDSAERPGVQSEYTPAMRILLPEIDPFPITLGFLLCEVYPGILKIEVFNRQSGNITGTDTILG